MTRVCVYCGSSDGNDPVFRETAFRLGGELAKRGIGLVYGGGGSGLMGAVADGVLHGGGDVMGVIPKLLVEREHEHSGLTKLIEVDTMHERKQLMADHADAFIALPGGIGTLEEVIEAFTWLQLGYHSKPVSLLNVQGFFDPLMAALDGMVGKGFLQTETFSRLLVETEIEVLLEKLERICANS